MAKFTKVAIKAGSMRNQCPGCGCLFNSLSAFDKHRITDGGKRRCMNSDEMEASGMHWPEDGWWRAETLTQPLERIRSYDKE